nr:hypothetical protein [Tanacetum cinerariifolium]
MRKFKETLAEGAEGTLPLGPKPDRFFVDLTPEEKERYKADIHAMNILLQGLPKDIYTLINYYTNTKDIWDNVKMLLEGLLFRMFRVVRIEVSGTMPGEQLQMEVGVFNTELAMQILNKILLMQALENGVVLDEEQLFIAGRHDSNFDDDVDEPPVQYLALNVDNVFQVDQCDAFDFDVDEAPTAQTMFMANLSVGDPIYDEAGPSYDLDILSKSALYNGHEIVKTNHAPAVVHDLDDTLKIAEKTRKKMLKKMKSPLCVEKRVKIAPPDYSKENYLATFTPQRRLTPKHIFWSSDILISKKNSKMTIVTPCGLTEGERGFEQTKECYLTEVIPFFKTLKEHFEEIQMALVEEVKEMKEILEQLEAEVEQNVMDKQYSELHDVYTVGQARYLELEAKISKLKHKIEKR